MKIKNYSFLKITQKHKKKKIGVTKKQIRNRTKFREAVTKFERVSEGPVIKNTTIYSKGCCLFKTP